MYTNDRSDSMCISSPTKKEKRPVIPRGCATDQFPGKLFDLLAYCENQGMTEIISWVGIGTAFMVHDTDRLLDLLPMFRLGQTKYRSFQRQLNMWHFKRVTSGPLKGAWMHPCFLKESRKLCTYMSRQAPSEGAPFDADPIPFLPLPHQKDEVDNSWQQRGRTKSTGEGLEQIPPKISFTNPTHSMIWNPADIDYQSSSISCPESRPSSQQQLVTMTALDDFVHPSGFMSTIPMALLEPTPILESKIPSRSNGSHRKGLQTDRIHVPVSHVSSLDGGPFVDRALSAESFGPR